MKLRSPIPTFQMSRRSALVGGRLVLLASLFCIPFYTTWSEAKDYRYEDDPVRLGNSAIEEGRLDDARKHFEEAIANQHETDKAYLGVGDVSLRQGHNEEAAVFYRQAIFERESKARNTTYSEAHAGLGLALLKQGKLEEAEPELKLALDGKSNLWEAHYGMARINLARGELEEAEEHLERGERQKGLADRRDLYLHGMATLHLAQEKFDEAEKEGLEALLMNPNDPEYGTLVADIYIKRGAPTLAISAYEQALARPGVVPTAEARYNLGKLYRGERQYNDALREYQAAVEIDSTHAPTYKAMGELFTLAKRDEEAAIAYGAYTRLVNDDPEGYVGLANAAIETRRYNLALEAAEKAYSMDSTNVDVQLTLARAAFQNKDRERAKALFAAVTDTTKFESDDYVYLGQLRMESKDYEGAKESLLRAVELDSAQADAYFALGLLSLRQALPDSSVRYLQEAIRLSPTSSGAHLNLGVAYLQMKRNAEAIPSLREAVRLAPDYGTGHIYLGQALVSVDSLDAALIEYEAARTLDPANASALRGLGFLYLKRGDTEQAVTTLREATVADPKNADAWSLLGQALTRKNDQGGAVEAFQKALAINPGHATASAGLTEARSKLAAAGGN